MRSVRRETLNVRQILPYSHRVPRRSAIDQVPRRQRLSRLTAPVRLLQPWAKPRVGLVGYFGWGNYGDELFVEVFQRHLAQYATVTILPDRLTKPYFDRPVLDAVANVDAVVIGGGDLVVPWTLSSLYWNRAYLERPVFIAGVGVPTQQGKHPNPRVIAKLRAFFQHPNVRWISTRDEASRTWIWENLEPSIPVHVAADLVCALDLPPVTAPDRALGIALRHRDGHEDDFSAVRRLAERAASAGIEVRGLVLATGATRDRDIRVAKSLGIPGAEIFDSDDLYEITRSIGRCEFIASMKFHGSVVASMYGRPSIVLMPTAKSRRFYERMGRRDLVRHFGHSDLPESLSPPPAPIQDSVIDSLRAEATTSLQLLGRTIASESRRRPATE